MLRLLSRFQLQRRRRSSRFMHAIMDAFDAHTTMSKQALDSERVRDGLKDILLGLAQLYEALRARSGASPQPRA